MDTIVRNVTKKCVYYEVNDLYISPLLTIPIMSKFTVLYL